MSNSSHWLPVSPGKKMGLSSEPSISFLVVPARDSEGTCTQGTTARPQTSTEHTRTETVDSSLPAVVQVPPESVLIKTAGGTRLLSDYDPGTIAARGPVDLWMKPAFDLFKKLFGERHMLMCTYAVVGPEDEFESEFASQPHLHCCFFSVVPGPVQQDGGYVSPATKEFAAAFDAVAAAPGVEVFPGLDESEYDVPMRITDWDEVPDLKAARDKIYDLNVSFLRTNKRGTFPRELLVGSYSAGESTSRSSNDEPDDRASTALAELSDKVDEAMVKACRDVFDSTRLRDRVVDCRARILKAKKALDKAVEEKRKATLEIDKATEELRKAGIDI